jgi:hypothetical protein
MLDVKNKYAYFLFIDNGPHKVFCYSNLSACMYAPQNDAKQAKYLCTTAKLLFPTFQSKLMNMAS